MAKTKIGTKLLANSAITTKKLGTGVVTRDKIQSGSVQVGHIDLFEKRDDIAHLDNADVLLVSSSKNPTNGKGGMRTITFAHLKAAVSASNAAVGDPGHIQFHGAGGSNAMDAISKIRTDGVHLTASDGGKFVVAYTNISGSTGEISSTAKTEMTINAKTTLKLGINGSTELELNASRFQPGADLGLNLGAAGRRFSNVYADAISGSGTSTLHKLTIDTMLARRVNASQVLSGSGTANLHKTDVDVGTFNVVHAGNITASATAHIHKVDIDTGNIDRVNSIAFSGSGTSKFHKLDVDLGTIDRVASKALSGSSTSTIHKLTTDKLTAGRAVITNLTSSGLAQFHNLKASDISGTIGEFRKLKVDILNVRQLRSSVTTEKFLEVQNRTLIAAVSQSAGAAVAGAGLKIGGVGADSSAGIASVVLGNAGGGAGADLLFKVGSNQGASLAAISAGAHGGTNMVLGVTGTLSASIGVFKNLDVGGKITATQFSGSSGIFHNLSGTVVTVHEIDGDKAHIRDVNGTSAVFTKTISGSAVTAHTLTVDKLVGKDVNCTSGSFTGILSGALHQSHLSISDKIQTRILSASSTISGSGTATIHKVISDKLSGSFLQAHRVDIDKLDVRAITTTDLVKAANLNRDIVYDTDNGNGGLNFANGVLSIGQHRQVFSRDATIANRSAAPVQGSGSLFTTASLAVDGGGKPTIIMSGSEMVYLNGVLLIPAPLTQRPPTDGDYTIDYNKVNGTCTIELHETLDMDGNDILVVQYLSGTIS